MLFCAWEETQVQNLQNCLLSGFCTSNHCYVVNVYLSSPTAFTSTVPKAPDKASRLPPASFPSLFSYILTQGLFFFFSLLKRFKMLRSKEPNKDTVHRQQKAVLKNVLCESQNTTFLATFLAACKIRASCRNTTPGPGAASAGHTNGFPSHHLPRCQN